MFDAFTLLRNIACMDKKLTRQDVRQAAYAVDSLRNSLHAQLRDLNLGYELKDDKTRKAYSRVMANICKDLGNIDKASEGIEKL